MKELGLDAAALDLVKYNPAQPRVPAGSGRWGDGGGSAESDRLGDGTTESPESRDQPRNPAEVRPPIIPIATDGPLKPGGIDIVPFPGTDPLDPRGLNAPLSLEEQQAITDTVNAIITTRPEAIPTLNPHPYENRPHYRTGAKLPQNIGKYTTYYVRSIGSAPGARRLIIDSGGFIYYTNNHYKSFYPVDLRIKPESK